MGKSSWLFPLPAVFIKALEEVDDALVWAITSRDPAQVFMRVTGGNKAGGSWETKKLDHSIAEWAVGPSTGGINMVRNSLHVCMRYREYTRYHTFHLLT